MKLITTANLADQDGFYQELIDAQRDLSDEDASAMNCRLVILLANHIGDREALSEAIRLAGKQAG